MPDALQRAVNGVVRNENCTGCGGCALISERISMGLSSEGWVRPIVATGEFGASAREEARRFRAMCPGIRLDAPAPETETTHPTFGRYVSAWRGQAVDNEIRAAGSSAGVLTALSAFLVETGRARNVRGAAMDTVQPTRTVPVRITSRAEALAASGSRYAPVANLTGLTDAYDAVVGKPCEISALRRLERDGADQAIALSFFCAGTPSQRATANLIKMLGLEPDSVTTLRYRGNGWPGEFTVSDRETTAGISYDDSWGKHLGRDLQWRCKICPDGTGEDADIAVGDFWKADEKGYPLFDDADGESVVLARTLRGHELLMKAAEAGVVALDAVELDDVERIQPLQRARKRTLAVRLLARALTFRRVPSYRGYGFIARAVRAPKLSAKTFAGTLVRSWRDRLKGRTT